jgi:hypothetical protein
LINCSHMLDLIDFEVLKNLKNALEPAKLAIEILSSTTPLSLFTRQV